MAAARDDPRNRLAAEEEEEEEEGEEEEEEEGEEETIGTRSETIDARLDVRVDEPGGSRSRSRVRPRVEIRLMPNDPALGRAYFVSYLRAIAYHRRRRNDRRRENEKKKTASSEPPSDASLRDADAWWLARTRRKGPLVLAASPEAYGRHWAHVLATRASRATARVTSGYLFLLLALDLAGQDEPPPAEAEAEAPPEAGDDDDAETSSSSVGAGSLGASATRRPPARIGIPPARIALYGFEDDPRNAADAAGGHYFDGLHKQRHDLYDLAWERAALAALVARRPDAVTRATYLPLSPDERLRVGR